MRLANTEMNLSFPSHFFALDPCTACQLGRTHRPHNEKETVLKNINIDDIEQKKRGRPSKSAEQRELEKFEREKAQLEKWRDDMRVKWGSRTDADGNRVDYTDADLKELERMYKYYAAEYGDSMTLRQKDGIAQVCTFRLEMNRCVATGDSAGAKRYSDMINSVMSREAMKAGDVRQLEQTRIDSLIVNLEKKGAIKRGKIVGRDELAEILLKDHPKYHTSKDAVESMLFAIINTMRRNNAEPELTELPLSAQVEDVFGELLSKPTDRELKAMAETGIVPPPREKPKA